MSKESKGAWPDIGDFIHGDWDSSCPCMSGSVGGVRFSIYCWRVAQNGGVEISISAPRTGELNHLPNGRSAGLLVAGLITNVWQVPVHILYSDGAEDIIDAD